MSQRIDRETSLRGLAHTIARRLQAVRQNGNATPELLAVDLVPEAVEFLAARQQAA